MADDTNTAERGALMDLIDAYAEAGNVGGCHTYNAKTAEARAKVVASLAASAGSEPVAPEDYVPMLDDEGRMMVGTSHHYTAENIRALVQQLRRFADPQQSTQADWDALDWRGWCNVLGRIVAALADEVPVAHPSPPEGMAGWTKASEQLPPCRDNQLYIGVNSFGCAGVFNAVTSIAGYVHCHYETAEESIDVLGDLAIWQPFNPPLPASEAKEL